MAVLYLQFRRKRLAEIQEKQNLAKFGDVREISASDYVAEVNNAGAGVWVVLHLYKSGYHFHLGGFPIKFGFLLLCSFLCEFVCTLCNAKFRPSTTNAVSLSCKFDGLSTKTLRSSPCYTSFAQACY